MGSNHLNHIFGTKSESDDLNEFLIEMAYKKVDIKRKVTLIQKYIDKLKQSKPLK